MWNTPLLLTGLGKSFAAHLSAPQGNDAHLMSPLYQLESANCCYLAQLAVTKKKKKNLIGPCLMG